MKKGTPSPYPLHEKAAIQSHRIDKGKRVYAHALKKLCTHIKDPVVQFGGLRKHTDTACIRDLV